MNIKVLEKVQERVVRLLSNVRGRTYEERLKETGRLERNESGETLSKRSKR